MTSRRHRDISAQFEYSVLSTPDGYRMISRINKQGYPWVMLGEPFDDEREGWAWADAMIEGEAARGEV